MLRSCPSPSCSQVLRPISGRSRTTQVSLVDAAFPGMLPVINRICVEQAIKTGLGINGTVNEVLDLRPQELFLSRPAAGLSDLAVHAADRLQRQAADRSRGRQDQGRSASRALHMEQDAGKSLHDQYPTKTYVDLNRLGHRADGDRVGAGYPLAGRGGGLSAASCARSCAISAPATATWRKGSMRCDANVSVRKAGPALRHALRDQERELDPLSSCRRSSTRRAGRSRLLEEGRDGRAGDATVRFRARV